MKTFITFLYYFFITISTLIAALLLILLAYAITDFTGFQTALFGVFSEEMLFGLFVFIVIIVAIFLVYNAVKLIIALKHRNKQNVASAFLIGIPMLMGIITMIYLLFSWQI